MKAFVSSHRTSVVALAASISVVSAIVVPHGVRWTGLEWANIALCALALTSSFAVSPPQRAATSRDGAPLGLKRGRTQ